MKGHDYDLAVIGGGLNGCAIARDAAGRGLSVFLCERNDLASGSTAAMGRLIHGDLRHVAAGRLSALRRDLKESEILRRSAPHVVRPRTFILPHHERQWPAWAVGWGLRMHDWLARRSAGKSRRIELDQEDVGGALKSQFEAAYCLDEFTGDGARLAVLNAVDARARGASVNPRLACIVAEREGAFWRLSLETDDAHRRFSIRARVLVNATGDGITDTADHVIHTTQRFDVRSLRTVAMEIARPFAGADAFALPNVDGRVVHVVPVSDDRTRVSVEGLTGDLTEAAAGAREVGYMCDVLGQYFSGAPHADEVVALAAADSLMPGNVDPAVQDHAIVTDAPPQLAPVITVFGGTLTNHRRLAERVVDQVGKTAKAAAAWTAKKPLPGGGLAAEEMDHLASTLSAAYPFVGSLHAERLVATYGARASELLNGARGPDDLGHWFGGFVTEREAAYLYANEWARSADDVARRTGLPLYLEEAGRERLDAWFANVAMRVAQAREMA